jgi:DNA-binding YbaB/EbfC family protein
MLMFKELSGLMQIMKLAPTIQGRVSAMQEKLADLRVEGSSGGGMVTVAATGQQRIVGCRIEPSLFASGDREMLEELIAAATNQALDRAREAAAQEMSGMMNGLDLPGLDETLSRLGMTGGMR